MQHHKILANSVVLAVLLLFIGTQDAHAYIDPGSGSYILQLILAGLLGAGVAVKIYWKRIKSFVLRIFSGRRHELDDHE